MKKTIIVASAMILISMGAFFSVLSWNCLDSRKLDVKHQEGFVVLDGSTAVFNFNESPAEVPNADKLIYVVDSIVQAIDGRSVYGLNTENEVDQLYDFLIKFLEGEQEGLWWEGQLDDVVIDDKLKVTLLSRVCYIGDESENSQLLNMPYLGTDSSGVEHYDRTGSGNVYNANIDIVIKVDVSGGIFASDKMGQYAFRQVPGLLKTQRFIYPKIFNPSQVEIKEIRN